MLNKLTFISSPSTLSLHVAYKSIENATSSLEVVRYPSNWMKFRKNNDQGSAPLLDGSSLLFFVATKFCHLWEILEINVPHFSKHSIKWRYCSIWMFVYKNIFGVIISQTVWHARTSSFFDVFVWNRTFFVFSFLTFQDNGTDDVSVWGGLEGCFNGGDSSNARAGAVKERKPLRQKTTSTIFFFFHFIRLLTQYSCFSHFISFVDKQNNISHELLNDGPLSCDGGHFQVTVQ